MKDDQYYEIRRLIKLIHTEFANLIVFLPVIFL